MSRPKAILASTLFTLALLAGIGLMLALSTDSAESVSQDLPVQIEPAADQIPLPVDNEQTLAQLSQVEAQYQSRLEELAQLAAEREATYETELDEISAQMAANQAKIDGMVQATRDYEAQSAQLQQILTNHNQVYEASWQEFEVSRHTRLDPLLAQLAEGQANLQQANSQLGW